jgi:hypothetical protein
VIHKVSQSKFYNVWEVYLNHIKIQTPRTDVCKTCRLLTRGIVEKRNKSTLDEHQELVKNLSTHLELVKAERAVYKQSIIDSTISCTAEINTQNAPNSKNMMMHYSFDYAQQIHIPHDPIQSGPMYFLVPYKVQIFGISNEALRSHHNYLNPESCTIGKGSDSVISFLHHYFENFGLGEKRVILHADNCVGQNKNRNLMSYLAYRILKQLHSEITIIFMPVGHTKFYCDLAFGLFKKKFKNTFVSSLSELEDCVMKSTPMSKLNQCQLVGNEKGDKVNVIQYDWSNWFAEVGFKNVPGISKFHYFKFNKPNYVSVKEKGSDEYVEMKIIDNFDQQLNLPDRLIEPKVGFERQKYLYENIRKYCDEASKDVLCPDPVKGIFSQTSTATLEITARNTERIRAVQKCSICRVPGHNKNKCPNVSAQK